MATPERPAGSKKTGWRFYVTVCSAFVGGALLVVAVELLSSAHFVAGDLRDTGLVIGGALIGLLSLGLNEFYRVEPERLRMEAQREAELQRHQEERRLDFEQYRILQSELREARSRASSLQAKVDLTGALDRDRMGDALLLGFYFHRRAERLPTSRQPIFKTAAQRLKFLALTHDDLNLDKAALHRVLELTYGPIVAEAFDVGYVLSHLGENGLPEGRPEVLSELENYLKDLKLDSKSGIAADFHDEVSGLFRKISGRVISMVGRRR